MVRSDTSSRSARARAVIRRLTSRRSKMETRRSARILKFKRSDNSRSSGFLVRQHCIVYRDPVPLLRATYEIVLDLAGVLDDDTIRIRDLKHHYLLVHQNMEPQRFLAAVQFLCEPF